MDYTQFLLDHLPEIDRVVHYIARRHRLSAFDTEEFQSVVRFNLIDHDFVILRSFQRRSSLTTFLTTVVERLYLDFCITRWGKWRHSAAARRLGPVAMHLERLVVRDGIPFHEAVATLQTNYQIKETREELHALFLELPRRVVRKPAGEDELRRIAARAAVDDTAFDRADDRALLRRVEVALSAALKSLPTEEQLLLKLHYEDGQPLARVARGLGQPPRRLYSVLPKVTAAIGKELQLAGITREDIEQIIGHPSLALAPLLAALTEGAETDRVRPSNT